MDKRLRKEVTIGNAQFDFQSEKGTIDARFILRQVQEKVLEKWEKVYDRVPREVVYWCMRRIGITEKIVRIVKATYGKVTTRMTIPFDDTEGSALSPFYFTLVLDTLAGHIGTATPWELFLLTILHGLREQKRNYRERS